MTSLLVIAVAAAGLAQVELRGGEPAPAGAVVAVGAPGVSIGAEGAAPGSAATLVVGWDRVKAMRGALAEKAAPWMPLAEQAWRARTRLERGDMVSSEPLLEKLFERVRGERGPTAAVVAEGLLRCRVRRGAHVAAVDPWLALLEAGPEGTATLHPSWAAEAGMAAVVDSGTGLAPALPPIWLGWPSVEAYARSTPWTGAATVKGAAPAKVPLLARLYHDAAEFEAGQPVQWIDAPSADPAVQLVAMIVAARVGDAERRASARKVLLERLRVPAGSGQGPPAPWMEAWIHAAVGRSLLREDATDQKQLGIIELLQVPARLSSAHPYLAGVALAESSVALRGLGDLAGADVLARELIEKYPGHPVHDWEAFKSARPAGPGAAGPVGGGVKVQ